MVSKLLVVVPCGGRKIWKKEPRHGPARAKDAYVGPPFKVNRKFAERFADNWVILSARYGLISPDFIIPKDYDVTFKNPSTGPITAGEVKSQVRDRKDLQSYDTVIALGGQDYTNIVKQAFTDFKVLLPTEGLSLGNAMHEVSSLTGLEKTEMLKRITRE